MTPTLTVVISALSLIGLWTVFSYRKKLNLDYFMQLPQRVFDRLVFDREARDREQIERFIQDGRDVLEAFERFSSTYSDPDTIVSNMRQLKLVEVEQFAAALRTQAADMDIAAKEYQRVVNYSIVQVGQKSRFNTSFEDGTKPAVPTRVTETTSSSGSSFGSNGTAQTPSNLKEYFRSQLVDNLMYVYRDKNSSTLEERSGADIKKEIDKGRIPGIDFFVMGLASEAVFKGM